jgi:acetyl-CoA carboxylase biotin carboxyl carrier protein
MSDPSDQNLPDLRYVRELAKVFRNYDLDEIEIENGEHRILLRRGGTQVTTVVAAPVAVPAPLAAVAAPVSARAPEAEATSDAGGEFITSPFVGTFYSSPRPDAAAFVERGAKVKPGDTVCIIEAMKLFNEIEAEFACVIEEVLLQNATPVEFGAKLFRVRRV